MTESTTSAGLYFFYSLLATIAYPILLTVVVGSGIFMGFASKDKLEELAKQMENREKMENMENMENMEKPTDLQVDRKHGQPNKNGTASKQT